MMRLLAVAVIALIANGIALVVGDLILDKMSLRRRRSSSRC